MRTPPSDPNIVTVNWFRGGHTIVVWEDPDEVLPWCLRWESAGTDGVVDWRHEEAFTDVTDALVRAGVISYAVEHDRRLVQSNLRVMSDHTAFEELVNTLLKYTTADRSSTALLHHVRR